MSDLLNQASLVMVPSGYKEDTVYSVVPSDGSGDLAFTRASNGTRINSAGLVEVCPWNLVQNSENFSAVWTGQNVTITTNSIVAPNGTTTADSMIGGSGSAAMGVYVAESTSVVKTISCYVKKGSKRWAVFIAYNGNSNCWFDLDNGVVGTRGAYYSASSITSVGNGWYRIDAVMTTAIGADLNIGIYASNNDNDLTCTGDGTTVLSYIWGFQLNIGSTAKPYFPTTDRLNVPRLTYQNGGGGCPSLLLEKQSTNLFTYSEQMDNSDWFKNNLTITANSTTSPDGTQNADLLDDGTASSTQHWIYQGTSFSNSTAYTISFYAKYVSRKYMAVNIYNGATSQYVVYDIQNGSVYGSTGDVTASITSVGNGWYRVVYTRTMSASGSPNFRIAMADDTGNETYTGSNKQVYLWGMQCEASSYQTSYIVSTSSSATRVADACFKTGISSLIGQTEGTLFADIDFKANTGEVGIIMEITSGAGTQRVLIYYSSTTILCYANIGVFSYSQTTSERLKIAFAYKSGDSALYVNGIQKAVSSASLSYSSLSQLNIGSNFTNDQPTNSPTNQAVLFKTRLTNAELASLTTI